MNDEIDDMVQNDLERFQSMSDGRGMDTTPAALLELVFATAAGFVAIGWIVTLYWVPDPVDGAAWMGLGALGLLVTAVPAAVIYGLRRGGAEIARQVIRDVVR